MPTKPIKGKLLKHSAATDVATPSCSVSRQASSHESHLLRALLADLVGIGAVVESVGAADLADGAEEGIAALGTKGRSRRGRGGCSRGLVAALKGLDGRAFGEAADFSYPVDNDFAALGLVGRADLIAALIGVCLSALEGLDWWAFGEAANLCNSVDDNFAAFGLVGRTNLVAALVGVCLGEGADSNAESKGDDGGVEHHVKLVL